MRKIFVAVCVSILFVVLMAGCASRPAPAPAPAPDGKPETVSPGESINIRFSTWHVPASLECTTVWDPMLDELEKRSNGRIKITKYYGGALGAGPDHYDIVAEGLSDIGYFTATWTPGRFPLTDVLSMPVFVGGKDVAVEIGNAMYERLLHRDFTDTKVLSLNGCIQAYFWTTKPVRTLEDIKGLRMRSPGGLQTYMIKALGAEPVFMPLGDVYLSMETGVIDGIVTCPQLFNAFKLYEVANHGVLATFGCVSEGVVMNLDSWNKTPEDLKKIILEVVANPFATTGGLTGGTIEGIMKQLTGSGVNFYELPPSEAERWNAIFAEDVVKKWVADMEAQGLPGKEALLMYKAEVDKHGVAFPAFPKEWEKEVEQYR